MGSSTACQSAPEQTHAQITLTGPSQDWTLLSIQGMEESVVTYTVPWGSGAAAVAPSLGRLVRPQPPAASPVPSSAPGSCPLSQKQMDSCSHKGDVWRSCCGSHGKLRPLVFLITPGVLFFLV